ncbi:AMP-binding protein [Pyrobaculum neutrophilum]|uniref:AMP-dependent synthetase and ligase n=1 Tax=Pyrobaculum neutrophilum (strain DSM 2338 / JCM 9278 / NBRC 100436 / V24Sta) TaxID=444157 RepID=B1YBU9_PYRNV|nr:AMP-binding protein [Pyrobaculum neutrophilum]ACB39333.1 AMP-dependent synthetase and ligase [Pyrobaculum neutrophilum V24Sta]
MSSGEAVVPPSLKWKTVDFSLYFKLYGESVRDVFRFWMGEAGRLVWRRPPSKAYEGGVWFPDGELSPYENVVGRHRGSWVWDKVALVWESEEGEVRAYTYGDLDRLVGEMAGVLRGLGVGRGDWVVFYAPPTPEVVALMLAAVRIGAPFEPVFTGWGWYALARRVASRRPKAVVTVDAFPRRGRPVRVKEAVDKAVPEEVRVLVVPRMGVGVARRRNDVLLEEVERAPWEEAVVPSGHPLFGLHAGYPEGPRPLTHRAGGYLTQTYATTRWLGVRPRDTYFCTVLPGWITGVTYVLFGPLMVGSSVVVYEGGPDYPHWDRWWSIIERYAVTVFVTTAGALRYLSRQDPELLKRHNLDTLRLIITTAEPMEVEIWRWTYQYVGTGTAPTVDSLPEKLSGRIPVIHSFIQTEFGTFVTGPLPDYVFTPLKPGSAGPPMPGFALDVVDELGNPVRGRPGRLVAKAPWPATPAELEFSGVYDTGDLAVMDGDLYIFPMGRRDGVLKVNGYRISPGEIKEALWRALGAEAEVGKVRDPLKFEAPVVKVKGGHRAEDVRRLVREMVGPIAEPAEVVAE